MMNCDSKKYQALFAPEVAGQIKGKLESVFRELDTIPVTEDQSAFEQWAWAGNLKFIVDVRWAYPEIVDEFLTTDIVGQTRFGRLKQLFEDSKKDYIPTLLAEVAADLKMLATDEIQFAPEGPIFTPNKKRISKGKNKGMPETKKF